MAPNDTKKGSFLDRFSGKNKKTTSADDSMFLDTNLIHEGISDDDLDMLLSGDIKSTAKPPKNLSPAEFSESELEIDSLDNVLDDDLEASLDDVDDLSLVDDDELLGLDDLDAVLADDTDDTTELELIDQDEVMSMVDEEVANNAVTGEMEAVDLITPLNQQTHQEAEALATDESVTEPTQLTLADEENDVNATTYTNLTTEVPVLTSIAGVGGLAASASAIPSLNEPAPTEATDELAVILETPVSTEQSDDAVIQEIEPSVLEDQLVVSDLDDDDLSVIIDDTHEEFIAESSELSLADIDEVTSESSNEDSEETLEQVSTDIKHPEALDDNDVIEPVSINTSTALIDEQELNTNTDVSEIGSDSTVLADDINDTVNDNDVDTLVEDNNSEADLVTDNDNEAVQLEVNEPVALDDVDTQIGTDELAETVTPAESMKAELTSSLPSFTASILAGTAVASTATALSSKTDDKKQTTDNTQVAATSEETSSATQTSDFKTVIHPIPDSVKSRLKQADAFDSIQQPSDEANNDSLNAQSDSSNNNEQNESAEVEAPIIKPISIAPVVENLAKEKTHSHKKEKATFTKPLGNKTMSNDSQAALIEKVQVDIDELKRKLHSMNSDFYNAATDSAVLISQVRELETGSAGDFKGTYTQSRELRRSLVEARKIFNQLASGIDMLEESLETDLFEIENKA